MTDTTLNCIPLVKCQGLCRCYFWFTWWKQSADVINTESDPGNQEARPLAFYTVITESPYVRRMKTYFHVLDSDSHIFIIISCTNVHFHLRLSEGQVNVTLKYNLTTITSNSRTFSTIAVRLQNNTIHVQYHQLCSLTDHRRYLLWWHW